MNYDLDLKGGPTLAPRLAHEGKAKIRKNLRFLESVLSKVSLSKAERTEVDSAIGQALAELVKL